MSAALRIEQHELAMEYMQQQNYIKAVEVLQSARLNYGNHVGILSDIISCLFLLGRFYDCHYLFKNLIIEFNFAQEQLSNFSKINTYIFISKMHEEFGEIHLSLSAIKEAIDLVNFLPRYQERVFANYLRISTEYFETKNLKNIYLTCQKIENHKNNILSEIQHSITLAELKLFGIETTRSRIENVIKNQNYSNEDKIFLLVDVTEFCLINKLSNPYFLVLNEFYSKENSLTYSNLFEQTLFKIINNENFDSVYYEQIKQVSPLEQLRIYRVLILSSKIDLQYKHELQKKLNFMIDDLDKADQLLIKNNWLKIDPILENKCILNISESKLTKNKLLNFLIKNNITASKISLEFLCINYFNEELSLSHYDRIRISIQRLNENLKKIFGVEKVFHVTKNYIEVANDKITFN